MNCRYMRYLVFKVSTICDTEIRLENYHKALHLGCCGSPRSAFALIPVLLLQIKVTQVSRLQKTVRWKSFFAIFSIFVVPILT